MIPAAARRLINQGCVDRDWLEPLWRDGGSSSNQKHS
jgi:hypothetical protein